MALTLGQLASGAGAVGVGMRQAEEAERVARQNQLKIEEQNRANQAAKEIQAARAGLQVPGMPNFAGGTGGQQFTSSLAVPVPQAPPAPATGAQAEPIPAPSDMDTGGFPSGGEAPPEQAASPTGRIAPNGIPVGDNNITILGIRTPLAVRTDMPAGRAVNVGIDELKERQERDAILTRMNYKYGPAASPIGGLFMSQTDEQRQQAKDIMDRLPTLSLEELRTFEKTGQLPSQEAPTAAPQAGVQPPEEQEPTAPAATKPSGKVAKATKSYDNAKTPYNDLINQAAQQYGIDPVVFKRLIGTESSFDPNAVSPRGESFGLGIGQIAEVHGLTREQRLDPNIAIPKAAEIFAQYLREADGDYTAALMQYKGASSEKGIAAMQEPVAIILNGTNVQGAQEIELVGKNPGQTADKVASAATAPAPTGVLYGPSQVAGGAQNPGVQSALLLRQTLANEYEIYNRNRMFSQADDALAQIAGIDLGLYKAQADQGIYELSTSGDASRAMSVLSQFTGTPTQALDRGDGTYDLYQNGRVTQTAVPVDKLEDLIRTQVDAGYRQRKAEIASAIAEERAQAEREFGKEEIKGSYAVAVERLKQANPDVQITNLGDGRAIVTEPGGQPYAIDLNMPTEQETPQGVISTGVRRLPIN